ncbi:MAG: response regulator [Nitrospiraceae bacterium]|nr:response regulator [Nitrospiraceae bacterium]
MSKGTILVIDDEDIVRMSCSRTLVPEGYEVQLVKNGLDGLALLEQQPVDLVLTDLKMPEIDGIEILRRIKGKWPGIEVIIITGYQTVDTAVKSIKLGAYDYLEKPFTPDALVASVAKAMAHKKSL